MLRAERIQVRFGAGARAVTVLDGVTLELDRGARLGLTGPSGSGKSTLACVLAMLLRPNGGNIEVDGAPVSRFGVRTPRALRRQVQLVWQSPRQASDPRLRLRQIILEPLVANHLVRNGEPVKERLDRWARATGLTDELLDRFPHEVSDGQLQRACLARGLILEPRYIICDEPTSMLDVSTQAAVLTAIAETQASTGAGVLLITHDRNLARHWCRDVTDLRDLGLNGRRARGTTGS